MRRGSFLRTLGPGLAVAATGVGAGDLMAAMLAGADFGMVLVWAIVVGAVLKLALNEGLARWQLATGSTLLEGWCQHLGRPFQVYFLLYLVVWSFVVAAGLMSACGVAAHALAPGVGIRVWGVVHSIVALILVVAGRYEVFEQVMKVLIGVMVVTLVASVLVVAPELGALLASLVVPALPSGSAGALLSLMGGVGGSVTLLSYGYWIRERGWTGAASLRQIRVDLAVGYLLTGVFGVAMLVLSASVLGGGDGMPAGSAGLIACGDAVRAGAAARLGPAIGAAARIVFLVGIWGAVASSTLGVWQGVPYLFADYVQSLRGRAGGPVDVRSWSYRGFLLYLALPPMVLLVLDRPIWVIRTYTIASGLFMPILAASLLWLGSRRALMHGLRNRWLAVSTLLAALVLFAVVTGRQIVDMLR